MLSGYVITNCGYYSVLPVACVCVRTYYCMPPDDGCMTETCCGDNIGGGEEELLH
jgi:hypothetical protein